jgi:hypothetical protein
MKTDLRRKNIRRRKISDIKNRRRGDSDDQDESQRNTNQSNRNSRHPKDKVITKCGVTIKNLKSLAEAESAKLEEASRLLNSTKKEMESIRAMHAQQISVNDKAWETVHGPGGPHWFTQFEHLKLELSNVLKPLFDNQNIIKQEMFLIRDDIATFTSKQQTRCSEHVPVVKEKQKAAIPSSLHVNNGHPTTPTAPPSVPSVPPPRSVPPAPTSDPAAPPPKRTSFSPKITKPNQTESPKMQYIGDSISANVDIGALEGATQANFVKAKANSSIHDTILTLQNKLQNSLRAISLMLLPLS